MGQRERRQAEGAEEWTPQLSLEADTEAQHHQRQDSKVNSTLAPSHPEPAHRRTTPTPSSSPSEQGGGNQVKLNKRWSTLCPHHGPTPLSNNRPTTTRNSNNNLGRTQIHTPPQPLAHIIPTADQDGPTQLTPRLTPNRATTTAPHTPPTRTCPNKEDTTHEHQSEEERTTQVPHQATPAPTRTARPSSAAAHPPPETLERACCLT